MKAISGFYLSIGVSRRVRIIIEEEKGTIAGLYVCIIGIFSVIMKPRI